MTEADIMRAIQLAHGKGDVRLMRVNSGKAWQGEVISCTGNQVTLANPRMLNLAPEGTPDLIGFKRIIVTSEMVGMVLAVYAAIECKRPGGKLTALQAAVLANLGTMGALSGVATSPEQAGEILNRL